MTTENKYTPDETLNRFKTMTPVQRVEIVGGAVDAALKSLQAIDDGQRAVEVAQANQLDTLKSALAEYAEPITEEVWEKEFRANVASRLDEAKTSDGKHRYTSKASRDVMVNLFKVATMGLTLAKEDRSFEPSHQALANLKKYAAEVRPKLQNAIDPETDKPRLRSIVTPPKRPKNLPEGAFYWLIGCEDAALGLKGPNAVIGGSRDLEQLRRTTRHVDPKYKRFYYGASKFEPLILDEGIDEELPIQNSAVFTSTFSPSANQSPIAPSGEEA